MSNIACMRSVMLLVVYLGGVFVCGGLLAPWLATGMGRLAEVWPLAAGLADHPFHRYVHRSLLLMAVVGLWPLLRLAGMGSWAQVGLGCSTGGPSRLGTGFLMALAVLSGIWLLALLLGAREWDPGRSSGAVVLIWKAASAGVAVGFLEEFLFRGVLFGLLLKSVRLWPALISSSLIFAALHFLGRPAPPEELMWWSGLAVVGEMVVGVADGTKWIPAGVALTLFGMLLGVCYWRTGDLFFSVGLHMGLVFSLKLYGSLTSSVAEYALWFWGSKRWMDGWLAVIVMGVLWWGSDRVLRNRAKAAALEGTEPELWQGARPNRHQHSWLFRRFSCAQTKRSARREGGGR
jgi:uncharacterized protein